MEGGRERENTPHTFIEQWLHVRDHIRSIVALCLSAPLSIEYERMRVSMTTRTRTSLARVRVTASKCMHVLRGCVYAPVHNNCVCVRECA